MAYNEVRETLQRVITKRKMSQEMKMSSQLAEQNEQSQEFHQQQSDIDSSWTLWPSWPFVYERMHVFIIIFIALVHQTYAVVFALSTVVHYGLWSDQILHTFLSTSVDWQLRLTDLCTARVYIMSCKTHPYIINLPYLPYPKCIIDYYYEWNQFTSPVLHQSAKDKPHLQLINHALKPYQQIHQY